MDKNSERLIHVNIWKFSDPFRSVPPKNVQMDLDKNLLICSGDEAGIFQDN